MIDGCSTGEWSTAWDAARAARPAGPHPRPRPRRARSARWCAPRCSRRSPPTTCARRAPSASAGGGSGSSTRSRTGCCRSSRSWPASSPSRSPARSWSRASSAGPASATTRCRRSRTPTSRPIQGFVLYAAILYVVIYEVLNFVYVARRPEGPRMTHCSPAAPRPAAPPARLAGRSAALKLGVVIVGLFAVMAVVSLFWTPYPPLAPATGAVLRRRRARSTCSAPTRPAATSSPGRWPRRTPTSGITLAVVGLCPGGRHRLGRADRLLRRLVRPADAAAPAGHELVPVAPARDARHLGARPRAARRHPRRRADPAARLRAPGPRRGPDQEELAVRRGRPDDRSPPAGVLFRHLVPNSTRPLLAYAGDQRLLGRSPPSARSASSGSASSPARPNGAR